jgi:hypothetical protein
LTLDRTTRTANHGRDRSISDSASAGVESTRLVIGAGDLILLLLFAVVGRWSHHEFSSGGPWATLGTAAPFVVGWEVAAPLLGAYDQSSFSSFRTSMERLLMAWPVALAVGLLIRSIVNHEIPAVAFVLVALLFNLLTLSLWRTVILGLRRFRTSCTR